MTHTHHLIAIEAKISMKARKFEQREKRNYNIFGFGQLLLCFFFFGFQLSQVILQFLFASHK